MKAMLKLFDTWWLQTLGYTLLHSLWQALIVAALVILILRLLPNKLSAARYLVASFALLTIALLSIATFAYLSTTSPAPINARALLSTSYTPQLLPEVSTSVSTYLANAGVFIQYGLPLFLMLWIFGTSLFSVRILAGLIYVEKLRRRSMLLQNEWTHYIQHLT
ncbi:MAG TPA: hypothetical protein VFD46_14735, partial [Chryseolinea sp.]|nr:hypothetical protein [Chryseolinea sp.]